MELVDEGERMYLLLWEDSPGSYFLHGDTGVCQQRTFVIHN